MIFDGLICLGQCDDGDARDAPSSSLNIRSKHENSVNRGKVVYVKVIVVASPSSRASHSQRRPLVRSPINFGTSQNILGGLSWPSEYFSNIPVAFPKISWFNLCHPVTVLRILREIVARISACFFGLTIQLGELT